MPSSKKSTDLNTVPEKKMIKCCIFDLDGTILDTINSITHFVNKTHTHFGVEPITVEECKYFAGNGAKTLINRTTASRGVTDTELVEKMYKYYVSAYDKEPLYLTCAFSGMTEMLYRLKANGIKLAVLSNKPDFPTKSAVEAFFGDVFDVVLGGREGVPLKPDPQAPREIMALLGVTNEETVWVGDTSTDIQTGKSINAKISIGCLWGFRKRQELEEAGADAIVSHPDEIAELVLKNA